MSIGVYHFVLGARSVPGETDANATVDSRERFYAAVFAGYGWAWLYNARQLPGSSHTVRTLAGVMAAGGAGRLLSRADRGAPHWFQDVLTVTEVVLPVAIGVLAHRAERES